MRELLRSTTYSTVQVTGVGTFRLPPIPLRVALAIIATATGQTDREEVRMLRTLTAEWLPLSTQSLLWSKLFDHERRMAALVNIIEARIPDRPASQSKKTDEEPTSPTERGESWWWGQIMQYRKVFGLTMEQVLDETWTSFVSQRRRLSTLHAQEALRTAEGTLAANPRSEGKMLEELVQRSTFEDRSSNDSDASTMTKEERDEYRERMEAKLATVQHRIHQN